MFSETLTILIMLPKVESLSGCLVGMSGDSTIFGNDLAASNQLNGKEWKGKK